MNAITHFSTMSTVAAYNYVPTVKSTLSHFTPEKKKTDYFRNYLGDCREYRGRKLFWMQLKRKTHGDTAAGHLVKVI